MKTLAVLAQKGGVGKSMVARSFAVAALLDGTRTAIVDADQPQGTTSKWAARRAAGAPTVLGSDNRPLADSVADARARGAELVLIDTSPHAKPAINLAVESADAAIIVTGPYPEDLEAVGAVAAIAAAQRKPTIILLNKAPTRAQALTLARAALASFSLPVCPTAIADRVSHPYASAEGLTAQEREPGSKAASEVAEAWAWTKSRLLT